MKKSLLLASMLVAAFAANAANDTYNYPEVDGYKLIPISQNSAYNGTWKSLNQDGAVGAILPSLDYVRSATCVGGKVYVPCSKTWNAEGGLDDKGLVLVFDAMTGEYLEQHQLTVDGAPLEGLLCANVIGQDDFGHIYVGGYKGVLWVEGTDAPNPLKIYMLDPTNGACTLAASLEISYDDAQNSGRVDQFDVIGDLTCQEARCVVMCAPSGAQGKIICGWHCEQGETEWQAHLYDGEYISLLLDDADGYPAVATFGSGASVAIVRDEDFSGSMFYVDCFSTCPALYTTEATLIDSFASNAEIAPKTAPCGVGEFMFDDQLFLLAGLNEYTSPETNQARLYKLGEGGSFEDATVLYDFPEAGLGEEKGAGARLHKLEAVVTEDAAGNKGAYIMSFKCGNGFAYYLFAEAGFNAGINSAVVEAANAPVEYFNLQGVRVANPENGIFIRRQGTTASKVVL